MEELLSVVAAPNRRKILQMIWNEEMSAGEIASRFDVTFGAVSQHLGVLKEAGVVDVRRDGNRRIYKADKAALGAMRPVLEEMWDSTLDALARAAESDDDD